MEETGEKNLPNKMIMKTMQILKDKWISRNLRFKSTQMYSTQRDPHKGIILSSCQKSKTKRKL
jgi:hypothetical protein